MKLYVADLEADTRELSAAQFGAYVRILSALWRKDGSFPLHHAALARIAGIDLGNWKRHIWPAIKGYFKIAVEKLGEVVGEVISQKRLSAELQSAKLETERKRGQHAPHRAGGSGSPGRGVPPQAKPLKTHDATLTESVHVDISYGDEARARARRSSPKTSFATGALNALDRIEARLNATQDHPGTGNDNFGVAAILGPSQEGANYWLPAVAGRYASG